MNPERRKENLGAVKMMDPAGLEEIQCLPREEGRRRVKNNP